MATVQASREVSVKPETFVQRKFAELCAGIQRVERLTHALTLGLIVLGYACVFGWYDYFIGASVSVRWVGFLAFVSVLSYFGAHAIRSSFRRINPYYVARQLERHLPESKNSLINWLDLHDDDLPSAFQKNLSARAAEQLQEGNPEAALRQRKHWVLLGITSLPTLALFVLFVLGPMAFFTSMARTFMPFWTPAHATRVQITLIQPQSGDAEVNAGQAVTFTVQIDGRVPTGNRPDAPKLRYRYQASEDFLSVPLRRDADDNWTAQLTPAQLRLGLAYQITAGDAETPVHQIRVRGRLHVQRFEVTYRHRPYRALTEPMQPFTRKPIFHGLRGTEVELIVRANRPVQSAFIEILTDGVTKPHPARILADDPRAFACRWTLEQTGQVRVVFTGTDGEANADRDWHPLMVREDGTPTVLLTSPAKDIELPENGTLLLEGHASDDIGVKSLTLHVRVADGPAKQTFAPLPYRLEMPWQNADGTYPQVIEYLDVLELDMLRNPKGTLIGLPAGTVLEYWLEAADNADYPNPEGNIGKSPIYKVLLTPAPKDDKAKIAQQAKRDIDQKRKAKHHQEQKKKQDQKSNSNGNAGQGGNDSKQQSDKLNQDNQATENKIQDTLDKQGTGDAKGADPKSGEPKGNPPPENEGAKSKQENQPPMPGDAGNSKEPGDEKQPSGEAKNDGSGEKKKIPDNKGERKDGSPENGSAAKSDDTKMSEGNGAAKDAGMMGTEAPPPTVPKSDMADDGAPMATAKNSTPPHDGPQHGDAKGAEQNGPEIPNKQGAPAPPTNALAKSGKMNGDKGEPKQGDGDPGQARDNEQRGDAKNPDLRDLANKLEQLAKDDAQADKVGKEFADLAKNADDPRVRELAKDILDKNGRDANTGQIKKGPNRFGSGGRSEGVSDAVKTTIANREFAARIGQMQLDDWKKRLTPDLLKRAGVSEADWQRFLKSRQAYDALIRQANAKLIRDSAKDLRAAGNHSAVGPTTVQSGSNANPLDPAHALGPPDLRDAHSRFLKK
jgi:hypothetical protein